MSLRALPRTPGFALAVLVALLAAIVLGCGDHLPFSTSARYVLASREMVERGDWVVPHLGGVPYLEKPILVYWLGAASQTLFGESWRAAHLPAALATFVMLVATWRIGARLRTESFGLGAALLLLAAPLVLVMATTLTTDPILAACVAVAWWFFLEWDATRVARWRWGFWAALAFGVLAKGPVALVIAGVAIGGFAFVEGGWRELLQLARGLRVFSGAAIVVAVNLPWTWLVWRADPRLLEFFYVRCNFEAFASKEVHHAPPWWYYAPVLIGTLAPASVLLLPAFAIGATRALRHRNDVARRARRFLACAVIFPLLFFTLSVSKLASYPLPIFPPLVVLAIDQVVEWDRRCAGPEERARVVPRAAAWTLIAVAALLLAAIAAAVTCLVVDEAKLPEPLREAAARVVPDAWIASAAVLLALGLVGTIVFAARLRLLESIAFLSGSVALVSSVAISRASHVLPELDPRPALAALASERHSDEPIFVHERFVQHYLLHLTVGERMRIVEHARELGVGHFVEIRAPDVPLPDAPEDVGFDLLPDHPWLTNRENLGFAFQGPQRVWLLSDQDLVDKLRQRGSTVFEKGRSGSLVLSSNRP